MAHVPTAERRSQLIDAAITLMTREGVAAGSTRAVAAEIGVAQMTVHYVFGSKAEFTREILRELSRRVLEQVRPTAEAARGSGFEESLNLAARALWETVQADPGGQLLWTELSLQALRDEETRRLTAEHDADMRAVTAEVLETIAMRHGQDLAVPASALARFFLAGFDGLSGQSMTAPDPEAEELCLGQLISATAALATGEPTRAR